MVSVTVEPGLKLPTPWSVKVIAVGERYATWVTGAPVPVSFVVNVVLVPFAKVTGTESDPEAGPSALGVKVTLI